MGMYPVICEEDDKSIKANNLLYLNEDSRHLVGLPFGTGIRMCWTDWNLFASESGDKMTDERRSDLESIIGGIRLVDLFCTEQIIYWGF